MLKLRGVHKRLGGRPVLDGVDLVCARAERTVVLGKNGSGKSTLLRTIAGIIDPDAGEIWIGDHSLQRAPSLAKAQLGYAPDGLESLPDLRAGEFLLLVRGLRSLPDRCDELELQWRERLGFADLAHRRLQALSFGQRKRVGLVCAIAGVPPLLLLDEPSNGLDASGVETLLSLLDARRARGDSELIATNDLEFAARYGGASHELTAGRLRRVSESRSPQDDAAAVAT